MPEASRSANAGHLCMWSNTIQTDYQGASPRPGLSTVPTIAPDGISPGTGLALPSRAWVGSKHIATQDSRIFSWRLHAQVYRTNG
jgi:hypothetical protein